MTTAGTGTQRRMNARANAGKKRLAALCAGALAMCGCFTKRRPTAHVISPIRYENPVFPPRVEADLEAAPEMEFEQVVAPPEIVLSHGAPSRPRVASPPAPERASVDKSTEPLLAPELTGEEVEAARAETQRNLDSVEKNLMLAGGRKLNASQNDLVSKIQGFTDSAREASRGGDWERAKNLSKKALVLSEQLSASL